MIKVGEYNDLTISRELDFGVYLDDGNEGILLPRRYVPENAAIGDVLTVFIYHDSEDRLIATTLKPKGMVGEIVRLKVVSVTPHGAFLDNGLMKDLFVPKSKQLSHMREGGDYLVRIYLDERTGRMTASEKTEPFLDNETLTVKPLAPVHLTVLRRTDIGYVMIINHRHTGVLHFSDIYRDIAIGDSMTGFIKKIYDDNRIDLALGKPGYDRVADEAEKIIALLQANNGYLPYHDKSDPEEIYSFFGMSKKTFKMTLGNLYKARKLIFTKTGIKQIEE